MDGQSNISGFTAMSGFHELDDQKSTVSGGWGRGGGNPDASQIRDNETEFDRRSDLTYQSAMSG